MPEIAPPTIKSTRKQSSVIFEPRGDDNEMRIIVNNNPINAHKEKIDIYDKEIQQKSAEKTARKVKKGDVHEKIN